MSIRTMYCMEQFMSVYNIPGSVIEMGVAGGDTTIPLSTIVGEFAPTKVLYACDTFGGLPYDDEVSGGTLKQGEINWGHSLDIILRQKPYITNIKKVVGLVEETLLVQLPNEKFCFAWIDMDLYRPTSFAYKFLEDRMTKGGIIGFHDYGFPRCPGIQQVVDYEIDYNKYEKVLLNWTCLFLRRK